MRAKPVSRPCHARSQACVSRSLPPDRLDGGPQGPQRLLKDALVITNRAHGRYRGANDQQPHRWGDPGLVGRALELHDRHAEGGPSSRWPRTHLHPGDQRTASTSPRDLLLTRLADRGGRRDSLGNATIRCEYTRPRMERRVPGAKQTVSELYHPRSIGDSIVRPSRGLMRAPRTGRKRTPAIAPQLPCPFSTWSLRI